MTSPIGTGTRSTGKQSVRRGSGFSEAELSDLFVHIGSILPITSHEKFDPRTPDALRRKFNSMVRAKPNTGDPECPWQVRAAKTLLSSIRTKTELETESGVENLDSSETEDDDGLIEPMESPIFEDSKISKKKNHEIIDVTQAKITTSAHTTERKKRKSHPKNSELLNFDNMPLGSPAKLKRKLIHGPNESTDSGINPMVEYMRLRDIRMEDENRKRWQEREETKREEKREERIMMARMEEERRSERNLARETNQSMMMMMMMMMAIVSGSAGKKNYTDVTKSTNDDE